jgi:hypothetical protein
MTEPGLRERKKARTRQIIADAAARLFAQRGYEQVAVSDVAREAEVSEQAGRRTREGQSQNQIADELRPVIEAVLDDLDAWLTTAADRAVSPPPPDAVELRAPRSRVG